MNNSTSAAQGLVDAIGRFLSEIGEHALNADPDTRARLAALAGKRIALHTTTPATTWVLSITEDGIDIGGYSDEPPHVSVSGEAWDLLTWLSPVATQTRLQIDGDITLLEELRATLSQFAPDPAEGLSKFIGEANAATIVGTAEVGLRTVQSIVEGIGRTVESTVRPQSGEPFTNRQAMDTLLGTMDEVRLKVDQLAARLAAFEANSDKPKDDGGP